MGERPALRRDRDAGHPFRAGQACWIDLSSRSSTQRRRPPTLIREDRSPEVSLAWHVAPLTLDNLDDLPKRCRRCVFWELSENLGKQAADFGSTELEKEAWLSEVLLEWGSCGRVVHMDGVPAGYVIYAPPSAVPRAAEMPTGPVSADAVL